MERTTERVNAVQLKSGKAQRKPNSGARPKEKSQNPRCHSCNGDYSSGHKCPAVGKECDNCGFKNHFAGAKRCPAKGQECKQCGKMNHYARKCKANEKSKQNPRAKQQGGRVNTLHVSQTCNQSSDEDSDYAWSIAENPTKRTRPVFSVTINGIETEVLADSGASVNILSLQDFEKLPNKPDLIPHDKHIYPYGNHKPLEMKGKFIATISSEKATCSATIFC